MFRGIGQVVLDDAGAELVEWALLSLIILITTALVMMALRGTVAATLDLLLQLLGNDTLIQGLPR